jgi:hypothetical protein
MAAAFLHGWLRSADISSQNQKPESIYASASIPLQPTVILRRTNQP